MTAFFQAARSRAARTGAVAMAVTGLVIAAAGFSPAAAGPASKPDATPADCLRPPATCYSPGQFRVAYGIQPLLDHGIDGRGETLVVPEVATSPEPGVTDIRKDLATFDSVFGLPAARIRVVNSVAHSATPAEAEGEEVEDTEIVHAVAPGATICVVLFGEKAVASAAGFAHAITTFLRLGSSQGSVLSISASLGEHWFTPAEIARIGAALRADQAHHVTVVASSGDYGAVSDPGPARHFTPVKEVSLPASDPLVLGVGGTSLHAGPTGRYLSENAWNTLPNLPGGHSSASAGGFSHLFARPSYQNGVGGTEAMRGVPDVAGDAAFNTGMALAFATGSHSYLLSSATGTSAATPLWAGLVVLADQFAGHALGFVNPAIYQIAHSRLYGAAFHDVINGNNTVKVPPVTILGYQATPGWDPVTGWGSPNAQVLVPQLALHASH